MELVIIIVPFHLLLQGMIGRKSKFYISNNRDIDSQIFWILKWYLVNHHIHLLRFFFTILH